MKSLLASLAPVLFALRLCAEPIALCPENPHYLQWRGKPVLLLTSAEHYGAVLNREFDFRKYLATLAADGLNHTRTFTGAYAEEPGAFKIERNTLAPGSGQLLCPWARSGEAGYKGGGNKFDLTKWDDAYFARWREFLAEADKLGIVVEVNLFTPMYEDPMWAASPMKAQNNVNGLGKVGKHEVYTLDKEPALFAAQEAMVSKVVMELNGFDNLYYEVMNEPYFGGVTQAWHDRIAEVIVETERTLPKKHLISWNVANGHKKIEKPHAAYSIFNFHYAHPPAAVPENYGLNKVIGLNETGFKGNGDDHYRMEMWEFVLAGGGIYNNLDYSFAVGHEDGTWKFGPKTPGGGGPAFRRQVRVLAEFMRGFDFVRMKPARDLLQGGLPEKARFQLLAEAGRQYAAYVKDATKAELRLDLPAGNYRIEWRNVLEGGEVGNQTIEHSGGEVRLAVPAAEVALKIVPAK